MSIELANEKWIHGDESGLLGQFASTRGYSDLIRAAVGYTELSRFFDRGVTENVAEVRKELARLAKRAAPDVQSTAKALLALTDGQDFLVITNGEN